MNLKTIAKQYHLLSAEERFRLILAAGARGDCPEQDRLKKAGKRIHLAMSDHAPFAQAFSDLSMLYFLVVLDDVAYFDDACRLARECPPDDPANDEESKLEDDAAAECAASDDHNTGANESRGADNKHAEPEPTKVSEFEGSMDLAHAAGFHLRTKVAGWKLFCKRMSLPPFALWQPLPGFARFKRRLDFTKRVAFVPEGMVRWLNRIRPKHAPEMTIDQLVSAARIADGLQAVFPEFVQRCGG
jgi:hypothetical protein